jgi:EmrB/QacA subfamily drug resistance transporter
MASPEWPIKLSLMLTPPAVRRPFVIAAVMAATFIIAIEATIVSTAMPQIAGQLGGLTLYSWVFSSFLLTQTATTVVFGKLADLYGRKPVLLVGIAIFLVGSILCGFATSMPMLIVFRLIQGVGAGAIQPVALTVVGDLYSVEERGKVQGYLASVWGISSVLGPLAGGLIIRNLSWAWIFWINVPVGALAAAGFILFLHEGVRQGKRNVDVIGAALFTLAVAALMMALTEMGTAGEIRVVLWLLLAVISFALFLWQERRAPDPMLTLALWSRRSIATTNAATLLSGMTTIGLTTFLPMYVQGVLNQSALVAGFALTIMVLGWPVGSTIAARSFGRLGLRTVLLIGSALLPMGAIAFVLLRPGISPAVAGVGSAIIGLGMGLLSTAAIVLIQDSVGWAERGAATASNIFARNLGSTLGAAVLGAVLNISLRHSTGAVVDSEQMRRLLDGAGGLAADASMRATLGSAIHLTFCAVLAVALLTLLVASFVPRVGFTPGPRALVVE